MKAKAMWLAEPPAGVEGLVQCSGDVDEFVALAGVFMRQHRDGVHDAPMALLPPEFRYYRWVPTPGGEFDRVLYDAKGPGRGAWLGAEIRVVQIGCSECQHLRGSHAEDCLNADITGLVTCQFGTRKFGPLSQWWIHAVRVRSAIPGVRLSGTPGPTLCGIPRFGPDAGGWSLGGGVIDRDGGYRGCYLCGKVAHREFPGVPISGTRAFATGFSTDTGVPLAAHLDLPYLRRDPGAAVSGPDAGCL